MRKQHNILGNIDWLLILIYIILVAFGWVNIYATSSTGTSQDIFDFSTKYGKQILWILLSIPLSVFLLFLNSRFYEKLSGVLYLISLLLLAGVLVFGKTVNGATAWYSFGSFSIQPAEFAKAFTALGVAKLMSDREYDLKLFSNQLKAFVVIFLPVGLIILQPDVGSILIYLSFFLVLNREGLTPIYLILGICSGSFFLLTVYFGVLKVLLFCFLLMTLFFGYNIYRDKYFLRYNWASIVLSYVIIGGYIVVVPLIYNKVFKQHHRDRIEVLLRMKIDNANIGYNSHQSELTISSGGLLGKGFLQGDRTQGHFVPEQHTDYIFSVVAEEWGFVGTTFVVVMFLMMILRIVYLSEQTPSKFGRIYGYSVASIFFFHMTINIGMVIGLFPTVGIPLPFFSYGGSGLWGFTLLLFIFIRLDANKENEY